MSSMEIFGLPQEALEGGSTRDYEEQVRRTYGSIHEPVLAIGVTTGRLMVEAPQLEN